jgi:hypothetical protein
MSRFYEYVKDLCISTTNLGLLSELSVFNYPKDFIFETQSSHLISSLKGLESEARKLVDEVIEAKEDLYMQLFKPTSRLYPKYRELIDLILSLQEINGIRIPPSYSKESPFNWEYIKTELYRKYVFAEISIVAEDYTIDDPYYVLYHSAFDEYLKITGDFSSYKGEVSYDRFEEAVQVVKPTEKVIIVYE